MEIKESLIETPVLRPGTTVRQALQTCIKYGAPGLPFVNHNGKVVGRFSLRHLYRDHCIPSDLVRGAHLLGMSLQHLEMSDQKVEETMDRVIDDNILIDMIYAVHDCQVVTALAQMEQLNTSYLFVMDGERYLGLVTRLGFSQLILDHC